MSSAAAKKKTGAKDRSGVEGTTSVASVQSAFTSAARATMWHADGAPASAAHAGAAAATVASTPSAAPDAPRAFTAAANAVCGRPFGATQLEDPWSRAVVVPCVHDSDRLLPNTPRWAVERAVYARRFACPGATPSASPPPENSVDRDDDVDRTAISDALYEEWLAHTAAKHSAPPLYPHHTLLFDATSMVAPSAKTESTTITTAASSSYVQVAGVLHRLLTAYVERCSELVHQTDTDTQAATGVPSRVFANLLYTSVYNNNFSNPPLEQRDTTFGLAELGNGQRPVALQLARHPPRRYDAMSVISCLGVSHVCVCVGLHYYKLSVVEERSGRLRSAVAMANGLEAIHRHSEELAQRDPLPGASPAARHDHAEMDTLFAQLSALSDGDAFEVRRRLRDASTVNVCSLDALQEGMLVLVLQGGAVGEAVASPHARWLHSVCSLEVSLLAPLQWTMRLLAAVVPCQAGLEWIARAASPSRIRDAAAPLTTEAAPPAAEEEKSVESAGQLAVVHALSAAALSTPVGEEGLTEYLELWLPEKHRVPLRPYPTPVWDPEMTQTALLGTAPCGSHETVEEFVLSLLQAVVLVQRTKLLPSSSAHAADGWWPRVVLAVQPLSGGAPSLIGLDSPAIHHYYEVLAARPMLFARETAQRIAAQAVEEVRALLNIAWHAATTVRTQPPGAGAAASWWGVLDQDPADLCVSFAVLPRRRSSPFPLSSPVPAETIPAVHRVVSNLGLSSALLVNCTAQQTAAEAHLRASAARVVDAVVQTSAPASSELAKAFSQALASCKTKPVV